MADKINQKVITIYIQKLYKMRPPKVWVRSFQHFFIFNENIVQGIIFNFYGHGDYLRSHFWS